MREERKVDGYFVQVTVMEQSICLLVDLQQL